MYTPLTLTLVLVVLLLQLAHCPLTSAKQKVLLYSRTAGYRHPSIPNAIAALQKLGRQHDFDTVSTANPSHFEQLSWLKQFDALVFISVSGQALTTKGEVNMMKYIEAGGGYMGIHEACDALYKSPWYGRLVGAYFNYHPYIQTFTMDVQSHSHPSTSFLGSTWSVFDEVYNFNSDPRDLDKNVVLVANAASINDPGNSAKALAAIEGTHPIAWYKEGSLLDDPTKNVGGGVDDTASTPKNQRGSGGDGRSFYTALGHTKTCWTNKTFLKHIYGGLSWVLESPSIRSNNATLPSSAPGSDPPAISNSPSSSSSTQNKGSNSTSSASAPALNPYANPGRNSTNAFHAANVAGTLSVTPLVWSLSLGLSLSVAMLSCLLVAS